LHFSFLFLKIYLTLSKQINKEAAWGQLWGHWAYNGSNRRFQKREGWNSEFAFCRIN